MKFCLLPALFWFSLLPAHAVDMALPAQVQVTVRDAAGHPLPDATVTLTPSSPAGAVTVPLSPDGRGQAERRIPSDGTATRITWSETLRVSLAGYFPDEETFYSLFPGAWFERTVALEQSHTTIIHLRGPKGEALAGVEPAIYYKSDTGLTHLLLSNQRTDEQGGFVFIHPPLPSGFSLGVGEFHADYPDKPAVSVTIPTDKMPSLATPHAVELTLIGPDGKPAAGWTVAPDAISRGYSFWGAVGSRENSIYSYAIGKTLPTDSGGVAHFSQREDQFVVTSPIGVSFLYPVLPQSWPPGLHRITLPLPAVRRMQTGQVVYPDGTPAAGLPVLPRQGRLGWQSWELSQKDPETSAFTTDAAGRYTVPVYFGLGPQYAIHTTTYQTSDTLATQSRIVLDPIGGAGAQKPADFKHVTLRFVDEQGKSLPDVAASCAVFAGKNEIFSASSILQDARAGHLFVPVGTDRLDLQIAMQGAEPLKQSLALSGTGDQTLMITLPQSLRFHPLQGVLLAPDARPVPNVTMDLFTIGPETGWQHRYLGYSTKTDTRGRFVFPAAPASCQITLSRFSQDKPDLPGWIDPPIVTPQTRDILIQLKPTGSVRVLLPPQTTALPARIFLHGKDAASYVSPAFDRAAHTLRFASVRPGDYALVAATDYDKADKTLETLTVQSGREIVLDLRSRANDIPPPPSPVPVTIVVTNNGKPVSGAVVTLQADGPLWQPPPPQDLTDDTGAARLPLDAGRRGLAVAHVAERLIGWTDFTTEAGVHVTIEMRPARSLSIALNASALASEIPPFDPRQVTITGVGLSPAETQGARGTWGVRPDGDHRWIAEDLPLGAYRINVKNYQGHLLAMQKVTLTDAAPPVVEIFMETPNQ